MKLPLPLFLFFIFIFNFTLLFGQETYTEVDGQRFHTRILGAGDVTVIFENGMSDSLEIWGSIPDSVARFAKVFTYDRADIGKSDASRQRRTIPNEVSELHSILEKENISPPLVLVGHSLGGLITRYFASQYSNEVVGLLLLDPAPEAFWNNMSKKELKEYIEGGNEWYHTKFEKRYWKEWEEFIPNLTYMNDLNIPENLPIILVSASAWEWYKLHNEIIEGFKNVEHVELEGEHHIFKDHPQEIIRYIEKLVEQKN